MWLPKWLYEIMPYVWFVVGTFSIYYIENIAAFLSGCLFMATGFLILSVRREARKNG
jgi:hypothetical protein